MRRHRPASRRATTAVLLGAWLVWATAACSTSEAELREELCAQLEADDYPELETLATRSLDGLEHSVERLSTCEEWGLPGATVVVELPDRPSRQHVLDLLVERGWLPDEQVGGGVYGTERDFVASLTEAWEDGPVVLISFSRAA